MMKQFLILLFLIFGSLSGFAQQRSGTGGINGTVVIDNVGSVGETTIVLTSVSNPANRVVVNSTDGRYEFVGIAAGEYLLTATSTVGATQYNFYQRISITGGAAEQLAIILRPGIRESVTVAADALQTLDEISKTVNTIGGQEMRDRADISLVDSLRSIPGFRIQQLGGFGRTASIKTRGLRNQDTAFLIDGFRIRDTSSITGDATAFLSDITLTSIDRIEILRGAGSSLYGTNATGGTVNFITPQPKDGPTGQVSYAVGGLGLQRVRGNITDAIADGRFGFNLAAARTVYTKGIDGNDDARNTNLQGGIVIKPSFRTNIAARMFFTDAFVKLNTDPDTVGTLPASNATIIDAIQGVNFISDPDDPDRDQRSRLFNGQVRIDHSFRADLSFVAGYSGVSTRRRNENGPLGAGFQSASTSIFEGSTNTVNSSLLWTPESHQFRVGYEFERETYANEGRTPSGAGNFSTTAGQSSHTIFLQDIYSAFEGRLNLAGGIRAQFFDLARPTFSLASGPYADAVAVEPPSAVTYDGSIAYNFRGSGTVLRAHIGTGYRVSSLYERYGSFYSTFPVGNFVALGDPSLKPEKSVSFDTGIEQGIYADRVKLTATYFYTKLTDVIGYGNVVPNIGSTTRPFGGYLNQKGGISRGGEFSLKARPTANTDIFASYTHTLSQQRQPQVSGSGVLTTLGVPRDQFTLVVTQRFARAWLTFDLLASSSYLAPIYSNSVFRTYVYRFGGNRRGDLTGGYTFKIGTGRKSLRAFGTIENIFDNEYYENGFRTAGANGRVGLAFSF